jgi:transposase InsO family protein
MPWVERSVATERLEFVRLAGLEGANRRELCRRFKISPRIGYKWLARFAAEGVAGLTDRSRRPKHSPKRTALPVEAAVLAVREAHPSWGGRKIKAVLAREEGAHLPAASTVTAILRRHGRIARLDSLQRQPCRRFERALPNELWQMDFKGHFALAEGRCHPLTALDDHSRYAVLLAACANEQGVTVQQHLTGAFRQHGLPFAILTDNGSPWGGTWDREALTPFTAWLVRLGIEVHHGRPYHPQTQGKEERFHRTLELELLHRGGLTDLGRAQAAFDAWKDGYNHDRPLPGAGPGHPGQPLPPEPAPLPRDPAADRVCRRPHRPSGARRRPDQPSRPHLPCRQGTHRPPGGPAPHCHRRPLRGALLSAEDRHHRPCHQPLSVHHVPKHLFPISPRWTLERGARVAARPCCPEGWVTG